MSSNQPNHGMACAGCVCILAAVGIGLAAIGYFIGLWPCLTATAGLLLVSGIVLFAAA